MFSRLLAPLSLSVLEERRENMSVAEANRLQYERVLIDELEAQWVIVNTSTDPECRGRALDEIDRIGALLRRT